jgi:hypothetical protein
MTHSNNRPTQFYLERGTQALTDNDCVAVTAPLTLRDMLGKAGTNWDKLRSCLSSLVVRPETDASHWPAREKFGAGNETQTPALTP